MKRIFCIFIALLVLSGCVKIKSDIETATELTTNEQSKNEEQKGELIGIWIPIYEIAPESNMTGEEYADKVSAMFTKIVEFKITDVFLQVRANCDSIYPSAYFSPSAKYCYNGELRFDALEIIMQKAHEHNLKIHAWINPYRISGTGEYDGENVIFNYLSEDDIKKSAKYVYIKPSSNAGRRLVLEGVREILENYDVDGIHIDDYFYPTTDENFDKKEYDEYISKGGRLKLADWRRENVNILVSSIYSVVKNCDESILFSISPCGDADKNYASYYADVETWCKCEGFTDIIIPQIYYGFDNSIQPFEKCLTNWKRLTESSKVKLVIGLAVYKAGQEDKYAGEGKNEWMDNDDIIKRQVERVRADDLDGFAFFSYNYIFSNSNFKNNEIINLKEVL